MSTLKIGIVGYSGQKFDITTANQLLSTGIAQAIAHGPEGATVEIVSGLTNLGIPALAYQLAADIGWTTVGVACAKAEQYDCYPVDRRVIVGNEWGDESATFPGECDVIVRVGGGKQSLDEVAAYIANGGVAYQYDLAALPV